jgi:hypothetical protein
MSTMTTQRTRTGTVTEEIESRRRDIDRATGGDLNSIVRSDVVAAAVLWYVATIAESIVRLPAGVRRDHPEIDWNAWSRMDRPSGVGAHPDPLFVASRAAEVARLVDAPTPSAAPTARAA